MECERCRLEIRDHEWHCPNCLLDVGAPNVRAAQRERTALAHREASARVVGAVAERYRSALTRSVVAVCRPYSDALELLKSDNQGYASFYQQVDAERRRPSGNDMDRDRRAADAIFFPYYERLVRFGALTLDGIGADHYGPVSIVLRPEAIQHRCSFFVSDTVAFVKTLNLGPGRPIPAGLRADWDGRVPLAVIKAELALLASPEEDFARILLSGNDYVEAHIFGPIHRRGIECLKLQEPSRAVDKAYVQEMKDIVERDDLPILIEIR